MKYKNHIPLPLEFTLILWISVSALASTIIIFMMQLMTNIKIVDFHVLLALMVACFGLLHTIISVIRNWIKTFDKDKSKEGNNNE